MNHYLAITIGPVYKTIKQARSTREIWAASYIFSILMREIINAAGDIGQLLSPKQLPDEAHRFGAGIYPDRAFWILNESGDFNKLNDILNLAISRIEKITEISNKDLNLYLRVYGVTLERNDSSKSDILELNQLLDNLELQEKITNPKPDLLGGLVAGIQKLYEDGHQNLGNGPSVFINYDCNSPLKRLPSVIELATADLKFKRTVSSTGYAQLVTEPISNKVCDMIKSGKKRNEYNAEEDGMQETIIQTLKKEYKEDFRFRHKYIAFIKADGDYMGKALGEIGNDKIKIDKFSDLLSTFTGKAAEIIVQYGGLPIYAGGDDLLFTLPLVNNNEGTINNSGRNIFELIQKIDTVFPKDDIAALTNNIIVPSLSYGISFSYYKYPMDETLETSNNALYLAKDFPRKNAVAFQVRKHSGQTFGTSFSKLKANVNSTSSFELFFNMLSDFFEFKDEAFLTSVMYKLIQLKPLLTDALINKRLENLFDNQFNEKDHAGKYKKYLKAVREFAAKLFEDNQTIFRNDTEAVNNTINSLHACLRFIQFLNQQDHE